MNVKSKWAEETLRACVCSSFERSCYFSKFYTSRVISQRDPPGPRQSKNDPCRLTSTRSIRSIEFPPIGMDRQNFPSMQLEFIIACNRSSLLNSINLEFQARLTRKSAFQWR